MPNPLTTVIEAATERFGEVQAAYRRGEGYVLLIKRSHPPLATHNWMTIRGRYYDDNPVEFNHGYYDMKEVAARDSFRVRTENLD